jgi:Rrf2 family protein
MLSQTSEYALRAAVILAGHPAGPLTTQQIATAGQIPLDYLSKVLNLLGRSGIVLAARGKGGGFTLTSDPAAISVLAVINAVDPMRRIRSCPLKLPEHARELCPLHRKLDQAVEQVEQAFASTSLAELVESPAGYPALETVHA